MANRTGAGLEAELSGLDSELVDLTGVPLDELRSLTTPALVAALERTYATAEFTTGNELQIQRE